MKIKGELKVLFLSAVFVGLFMASVGVAQTSCIPAPEGIIAWWPADGVGIDVVGSNNVTLYGGTTYVAGKTGQAFDFNGADAYASAESPYLTDIADTFTVEFWAWPRASRNTTAESNTGSSGTSGQRYAVYPWHGGSSGPAGMGVSVGNNGVSVFEHAASYLPSPLVYDTPVTNWTHVAVVYTNKQPSLYLNGSWVRTGLTSSRSQVHPSAFFSDSGTYGKYNGLLDEISIYDRALTSNEVAAIFQAGSSGKCYTNDPAPVAVLHPESQSVIEARTATFDGFAMGSPRPDNQWLFDGLPIPSATNATLTFTNAALSDAGDYSLMATNQHGSVTSSVATLTIIEDFNLPGKVATNCIPKPDGLIAWWPGDGFGFDVVGENHGTLAGGATYATGKVGRAFLLDGSDDFVDLGAWSPGSTWTVEAWVCPSSVPSGRGCIVGGFYDYRDWGIITLSGKYSVGIRAPDGSAQAVISDVTAYNDVWCHIAGTCDGSTAKIFVNGILQNSASVDPWYVGTSAGARIGGAICCPNDDFPGRVDEVSVYDRALDPLEIAQIYAAGSAGKCYTNDLTPHIVDPPLDQYVALGSNTTLNVWAIGTEPLYYQWLFGGTNIVGATETNYPIVNATTNDSGFYSVAVSNAFGSVTSAVAEITVVPPPTISVQPQNVTLPVGSPVAQFSVTATSITAFTYQWRKDGVPIPDATNSSYTISPVRINDLGNYVVEVSNFAGTTPSDEVMLTDGGQPATPCVDCPQGLIGWWPGNNGATNVTGINHGTLYNGATNVPGVVDQCFSFDGANDYVAVPDHLLLSPHVGVFGEMSVMAWIWVPSLPGSDRPFVAKGSSSNWEYALYLNANGSVGFRLWPLSGSGYYARAGGGAVTPGQWHHVAGTLRKGQFAQAYLDGVMVGEDTTFSSDTGDGTSSFWIGRRGDGYYFPGQVDEVALFNRALGSNEVAAVYAAGSAGMCLSADSPPTFVVQPSDQTAIEAQGASFNGLAVGASLPGYQWLFDGSPVVGETNVSLVLTNIALNQAGEYSLLATNPFGAVTSSVATLTVIEDFNLPGKVATNCVPKPDGLIAWWPGDGFPHDVVGNNDGTLQNGASYGEGKIEEGFQLDGADDYVDIGDLAGLDGANEMTVITWLKKESASNPYAGFVGKYNTSSSHDNTFLLYNGEGTAQNKGRFLVVFDDSSIEGVSGSSVIPVGEWTCIAGTWQSSDGLISLYKNGTLEASTTGGVGKQLNSHRNYTAKIGEWGVVRDANYKFHGLIDETAIFNRALTSEEIAHIYAAGPGGMCYSNNPAPVFVEEPLSQTGCVVKAISLSGAVMGVPRPNYQWIHDGEQIPDATNATYTINTLSTNHAGEYILVASNVWGSVQSAPATLTVLPYVLFDSDATLASEDLQYEGQDVVFDGATITVNGMHSFRSLSLTNSAHMNHSYGSADGISLMILEDMTINTGCTVNVDGKGNETDGRGYTSGMHGGGGGYGGKGGNGTGSGGNAYGSVILADSLGSVGGNSRDYYGVSAGGKGGGRINISVAGNAVIDGTITASGLRGASASFPFGVRRSGGGGSGGSIHLEAASIGGMGEIKANGGNGGYTSYAGGGSGGRIVLSYSTNTFVGTVSAQGGAGAQYGGAGTIFMIAANQTYGSLNMNNADHVGAITPLPAGTNLFDTIEFTGGARLKIQADTVLGLVQQTLVFQEGTRTLINGDVFCMSDGEGKFQSLESIGSTLEVGSGGLIQAHTMLIDSNALVEVSGGGEVISDLLDLRSSSTFTLNASTLSTSNLLMSGQSTVNVDNQSVLALGEPELLLGGASQITLDGQMLCLGTPDDAFDLVAIQEGSALTLGDGSTLASLQLTVGSNSTVTIGSGSDLYCGQAQILPAGTMRLNHQATFDELHILTNGVLQSLAGNTGFDLLVHGDFIVDDGGRISADGLGYSSHSGPGAGGNAYRGQDSCGGGGAGYGGDGGSGNYGVAGTTYGELTHPNDLGSGGGYAKWWSGGMGGYPIEYGGSGGGVLQITVSNRFILNGNLSADGLKGETGSAFWGDHWSGGGGSGGSIVVNTRLFEGAGVVSANGGRGGYTSGAGGAGGGAGGRIALDYDHNIFNGTIRVGGGEGRQYGKIGTVWVASSPLELDSRQDFERSWEGWYSDNGLWQVGMPISDPGMAYSGTNAAGTILNGLAPARSMSRFISPIMMIPAAGADDSLLMRFWHWYDFGNGSGKHQISVQESIDEWSDWATFGQFSYSGNSGEWERSWIDLSEYAGKTVRLAFLYSGGTSASAGWYIDDLELDIFSPPPLSLGELIAGSLSNESEQDYYVIQVPSGGHLMLTLDDLDDLGANEVYIKHGSLPTAGDFDYKFSDFGAADQFIYVPGATPGYWFIMVTGSDVPVGGSDYTIIAEHGTGVILDSVTPDHYGAAGGARLTFAGAGFTPSAEVELVRMGSVVATATAVDYFSGTKISADFDLSGLVPANDYTVRVRVDTSEEELPFTVMEPLPAKLETNMLLPGSVGYHRPATIWVEYENTGQVAMEAPLLVVGAKQLDREGAILTLPEVVPLTGAIAPPSPRGFWTSSMPNGYANTVQFLASGEIPGLLQPGEKGRFPVYWAGWQKPWSFSYPPITFTLGVVEDSNTNTINWAEMKDSMKPDSMDADTWDALWQAFTAEAGGTWGTYVEMLQDNATYLGRQGLHVNEISELLAFEFAQADGMNVVRTLASSTDAHVVAPGLDISFGRSYGQSISSRHALGSLGYGWTHNWDYHLEFESDGTIRMAGPGGSRRTYQPDSRSGRPYFSMEGDHAEFKASGGGYLHTESSGYIRFFDSTGKLEYVEDTHGNRITCSYSGDHLTRLDHSAGQYLDIGWSGDQIASVTDPDGRTTDYSYIGGGNYLDVAQFYDGSSVSYDYEMSGSPAKQHALLSITLPGNTHQYFDWDANGRLAGISRDGGTEPVNFSYGDAGEVYIEDAFGNTSSYFLNQNGVLVRAVDPQGDEINLKYDLDYNLAKVIDPEGRSHSYDYDKGGNMTRMTDPLGYVTRLSYSGPFDRMTALVDAKGNITRYAYDGNGGLESITYDDGSVESWSYDGVGNPNSWNNRRGSAIGYEYDADGRLTAKVFTNNVRTEYVWDSRGNLDYTVDASGTNDFTYDANDFLVRIDYPGGHWLGYAWNEAGQRTALTNELGNVQHYHYDGVGRLSSMTNENGELIVDYEYDAAGRLETKTLGNGVYTAYAYNEAWELEELSNRMPDGTILSQFDYEYDSRGRRVAMTSTYGQADDPRTNYMGRWTYDYDDLGQLIAWQDPSGHRVEYEYDGLGNRINVNEDGTNTAYTVNNLNQYTQVGDTTYTFDLDGNLVREERGDGSWTAYTYNDENRLAKTETSEGVLWEYEYNALGHRNRVTENGDAETHIVDPFGLGNLVGVHPEIGDPSVYTHGFGLVNQQVGINPAEWFTFDAIGSVQDITLPTGGIGQQNVYKPFGASLLKVGTSVSRYGTFGASGIQEEKDMLFMRARQYNPPLGCFVSPDPIGITINDMSSRYKYVNNSPVYMLDPSGLNRLIGGTFPDIGRDFEQQLQNFTEGAWGALETVSEVIMAPYVIGGGLYVGATYGPQVVVRVSSTYLSNPNLWNNVIVAVTGKVISKATNSMLPLSTDPSFVDLTVSYAFLAIDFVEYVVGLRRPSDPNLKTGPAGYGAANYVGTERLLNYRVDFENDASATAPAQTVTISDPLSADLDWTTFTLTEVGFGDEVLTIPPGCHHYQHTVEMSQSGTVFEVEIDIGVNLGTGELYANFYSLDPLTGLPPEADIGMLPSEDGTGRGMGYFNYTIESKSGLSTGTEIRNIAFITFDGAETIRTDQVDPHDISQGIDSNMQALVTIDTDVPSSQVISPTGTVESSFTVTWGGTDIGAGISGYDIYVSMNSGPWTLWLNNSPTNTAVFQGHNLTTYGFYSIARDGVGNVEAAPVSADITVNTDQTVFTLQATSTLGGSIIPSGDVEVDAGTNQTFTITPDMYWHIEEVLANGLPLGAVTSHTFTNVYADGLIHARFAQNMVTNGAAAVPEWWLAQYGWTNNMQMAVTNDADGDGFKNWEEFMAGSSPTNKASIFRITQIQNLEGEMLLSWSPSISNRQYKVMQKTSLTGPFADTVSTVTGPANSATVPTSHSHCMLRMAVDLFVAPPQWAVMAFAGPYGSINPSGLHYVTAGSNTLSFTVSPNQWYHIADVETNGVSVGPVGILTLSNIVENTGIRAEFAQNMVTSAPTDVPEQWLAQYNWTNDFPVAVTNDSDGDGFMAWQEYVADSDPTNAASFFHITKTWMEGSKWIIEWEPAASGRVYTPVLLDLMAGTNATLPTVDGPDNTVTNGTDQSTGMLRVEVDFKE